MTQLDQSDFDALKEARQLLAQGQSLAALKEYQKAVATRPDNLRARLEISRILGAMYRIADAESHLDRAEELAGSDVGTLQAIADCNQTIYRPQQAIRILRSIYERGELAPVQMASLAVLLEVADQLPDALAAIEACLHAAPDQPEALLISARLERRMGQTDLALKRLVSLQRQANSNATLKIRVGYELAKIWDQRHEYALAIEALSEAKALQLQLPGTSERLLRGQQLNRSLLNLHNQTMPDSSLQTREQVEQDPSDPLGLAFLVGFPRSGTTLIERILDSHPQLVASPERPVFTQQIVPRLLKITAEEVTCKPVTQGQMTWLRQHYVRCLESIQGASFQGQIHLDKNPNHTSLLLPILQCVPQAKIIFALRDPRDVFVSNFVNYFPLTEFSSQYLNPDDLVSVYANDMAIWSHMREKWTYECQECRYERVVVDAEQAARNLIEFLGLPWCDSVMNYRSRDEARIIHSPSHAEVRQPIHQQSLGRWKAYLPWFERQFTALEDVGEELGYR